MLPSDHMNNDSKNSTSRNQASLSDIKIANHQNIYFIACASIIICGASVDMFVPSLPAMQNFFGTSPEIMGLIVTTYLLAYGVGQLPIGALIDSFGRKKIFTGCMYGFASSTLLIPYCSNIHNLLLLRACEGIFAAGIGVTSRALLPDCYAGKILANRTTFYALSWSLGPVFSPLIGGYLQLHFSWHSSFYVLGIYALVMAVLVTFKLIETAPLKHPFEWQIIKVNYKHVLTTPVFYFATLACGLTYGLITSFNVSGPFLIESVLKYNSAIYGYVALLLGVAWTFGNLTCRAFVSNKRLNFYLALTAFLAISIATVNLLGAIVLPFSLLSISIPTTILFFCGGIFFPYSFGLCLRQFPNVAGTASACMGATYSVMAGFISAVASFNKAVNGVNIAAIFLILTASAVTCIFLLKVRSLSSN